METYLFYVNAVAGQDEWTDRRLICKVEQLTETPGRVIIECEVEDHTDLQKFIPQKSYALQFEVPNKPKELKYYKLNAFEIRPPPTKQTKRWLVTLHVTKIEVEVPA